MFPILNCGYNVVGAVGETFLLRSLLQYQKLLHVSVCVADCCHVYLQINALQQLLHRCGFGMPGLSPPARLLGLHLLVQNIHVDELEGADFPVEHSHPGAHRRLTDDVDHVSTLQ